MELQFPFQRHDLEFVARAENPIKKVAIQLFEGTIEDDQKEEILLLMLWPLA